MLKLKGEEEKTDRLGKASWPNCLKNLPRPAITWTDDERTTDYLQGSGGQKKPHFLKLTNFDAIFAKKFLSPAEACRKEGPLIVKERGKTRGVLRKRPSSRKVPQTGETKERNRRKNHKKRTGDNSRGLIPHELWETTGCCLSDNHWDKS